MSITSTSAAGQEDGGDNHFILSNGIPCPLVGFGTAALGESGESVVSLALENGFRHIDTAAAMAWYDEVIVGKAMKHHAESIPRQDIFLTTKIHPRDFGYQSTLRAADVCLDRLQTDYMDLLLLHTPQCWHGFGCRPEEQQGTYVDAWKALEKLLAEGKVRSIGVSNFDVWQLEDLVSKSSIPPMVVQNWMDPLHQDRAVREWCKARGILYTSYSTLGTQHHGHPSNPVLTHPVIQHIAAKKHISTALITLAWALKEGVSVIPRSTNPSHIKDLSMLLDRKAHPVLLLTEEEMQEIQSLEGGGQADAKEEL